MNTYKNQNNIFSDKGFYIGVMIFILGLILMITRVILDVNSMSNSEQSTNIESKTKVQQQISNRINYLQGSLDEKIKNQEETFYSSEEKLKILEKNKTL